MKLKAVELLKIIKKLKEIKVAIKNYDSLDELVKNIDI